MGHYIVGCFERKVARPRSVREGPRSSAAAGVRGLVRVSAEAKVILEKICFDIEF